MKLYKIPVEWTMTGTVEVESESLLEAIDEAYEASLPDDGEYMDGSFVVQEDLIDYDEEEND
jgi:hypothetical protein